MTCEHRMAWGEIRIDCEKPEHEGDPVHEGTLHASKVSWVDGDRRDYTGPFVSCRASSCVLPGGHTGGCAR